MYALNTMPALAKELCIRGEKHTREVVRHIFALKCSLLVQVDQDKTLIFFLIPACCLAVAHCKYHH